MANKIFVRDDDVLIDSRTWSDPFQRFKQIHEWIESTNGKIVHIPTIIVNSIKSYPDCIQYIKDKTQEGSMQPEVHCLDHIDYGKLVKSTVLEHLKICKDYIFVNFNVVPTKFYTTWGSSQPHLHEAAAEENLTLIDCSSIIPLEGRYGVVQRLKDGESILNFDNKELFIHWWTKGARLARVCAVARYGNWQNAEKAEPQLFR